MRTTQAARYARWSAAMAILLAMVVAVVFARRVRHTNPAEKAASVPASVTEQSAGFSFSKVTGDQTQFTLRASRATQFKEGDRAQLEDVWVTSYGSDQQPSDNLHTQECDYLQDSGQITCPGDVQIDMQNPGNPPPGAAKAGAHDNAAGTVHVRTSRIVFERQTGIATTDQRVDFSLPQGQGSGTGVRYDSQLGELRLLRDVRISLRQQPSSSGGGDASTASADSGDVNISSSSLVYRRKERVVHLLGPVEVTQEDRVLRGQNLDVHLDDSQRVRQIVAADRPLVSGVQDGDPVAISADTITADVSADGWIERITAAGNVQSDKKGSDGDQRLTAQQVVVEYTPGSNQVRRITATGDVDVQTDIPGGASRHMATSSLVMDFAPASSGGNVHLAHATMPAVTLDDVSPAQANGHSAAQSIRLTSQQMEASFGEQSDLRDVHASGGVEVRRQIGDAQPMTSSSREMAAQFAPGGEWSAVDQTGDVRLQDGDKTAGAPHVHFDRAANTAALSGSIVLTDANSRTTAQSATFAQSSNEFYADGNVVTTEFPAAGPSGGSTPSNPDLTHLAADHLAANTVTDHAVYSGHARLWQGDSVVEADSVELDQGAQSLTAIGRVHAIFPQNQPAPAGGKLATPAATGAVSEQSGFMQAGGGRLTYLAAEHRARLDQGATTQSDQGRMRASSIDLFFTPRASQARVGAPPAPAPADPAAAGLANQSIERVTALGDVEIDANDRHAKSGRADYTAADGKFVLSGEYPTVYDALGNAAAGRQLTFVFGDDRIVVDSPEGTRTLTLHQVAK